MDAATARQIAIQSESAITKDYVSTISSLLEEEIRNAVTKQTNHVQTRVSHLPSRFLQAVLKQLAEDWKARGFEAHESGQSFRISWTSQGVMEMKHDADAQRELKSESHSLDENGQLLGANFTRGDVEKLQLIAEQQTFLETLGNHINSTEQDIRNAASVGKHVVIVRLTRNTSERYLKLIRSHFESKCFTVNEIHGGLRITF